VTTTKDSMCWLWKVFYILKKTWPWKPLKLLYGLFLMGKITLLAYFTSSPTIVLYLNLEEIYSKLMKKCTGKVLIHLFQILELFHQFDALFDFEDIYTKLMKKCTGKVLLQFFQTFELFHQFGAIFDFEDIYTKLMKKWTGK